VTDADLARFRELAREHRTARAARDWRKAIDLWQELAREVERLDPSLVGMTRGKRRAHKYATATEYGFEPIPCRYGWGGIEYRVRCAECGHELVVNQRHWQGEHARKKHGVE